MSAGGWIAAFGLSGLGAVGRLLVGAQVMARTDRRFPLGTLAVNLSGALVLGVLAGLDLGHDALLLAGTALVGAYTTFSTWMGETADLAADGRGRQAVANVAVSLVLGVALAAAGRALALQV